VKKVLVFSCAIIVLSLFLAGLVYSQSLEEIRAQVKAEVRRNMGLDEPVKQRVQQQKRVDTPEKTKLQILQEVALIAMLIAVIPATIAKIKGRSFIAWWVLGLLCFIVVLPVSVYMKKLPKPAQVPEGRSAEPS